MKGKIWLRWQYIAIGLCIFIISFFYFLEGLSLPQLLETHGGSSLNSFQMGLSSGFMGGGYSLEIGSFPLTSPINSSLGGFSTVPLSGSSYFNTFAGNGMASFGGLPLNLGGLQLGGSSIGNNMSFPINNFFSYPTTMNYFSLSNPFNMGSSPIYYGYQNIPDQMTNTYSYGSLFGMSPGPQSWGSYGGGSMGGNYYNYTPQNYYSYGYTTANSPNYYNEPSSRYFSQYGGEQFSSFYSGYYPSNVYNYNYGYYPSNVYNYNYGLVPTSSPAGVRISYCMIEGYIKNESGYVEGATIKVNYRYETRSNENGYYYFHIPEAYTFTIEASLAGYSNSIVTINNITSYKRQDITLIPIPGQVRGNVAHEGTNIPLKGVKVVIKNSETKETYLLKTMESGDYSCQLEEGNYNVEALVTVGPRTLGLNKNVEISSGDINYLDFKFIMSYFSGVVLNNDGESIRNAEVTIEPGPTLVTIPLTDSEGKFGKVPLPPVDTTKPITALNPLYKIVVKKSGYKKETINLSIDTDIDDYEIILDEEDPDPPVILSPKDPRKVEVGKPLSFSVVVNPAVDLDLLYSIKGPAGWPTSDTQSYFYTPTLEDIGEHEIEIEVEYDDYPNVDPETVTLTVVVVYNHNLEIESGRNLINYPFDTNDMASELLPKLGTPNQVSSLVGYDPNQREYQKVTLHEDGTVSGDDFSIERQAGYLLYAKQKYTLSLEIDSGDLTYCEYQLHQGINLIGIPLVTVEGYSSYDLLLQLGKDFIENLFQYNAKLGKYEYTYWIGDRVGGKDFPLSLGKGCFLNMKISSKLSIYTTP